MTPLEQRTSNRPAILLSGRPGVGKTTVIRRLAESLSARVVAGFFTDEIRVVGQRQGFRVSSFSGATDVLAHTKSRSQFRVGRYCVDVDAFERIALPELAVPADLVLIDEIGKMECFSSRFVQAVRDILTGQTPIVATVALSGTGFIADVKRGPDVEVWDVTIPNRDELPAKLAERLLRSISNSPAWVPHPSLVRRAGVTPAVTS